MAYCLMATNARPMTVWVTAPLSKAVWAAVQAASKISAIFSRKFLAGLAELPLADGGNKPRAAPTFALKWKSALKRPLKAKTRISRSRLLKIASAATVLALSPAPALIHVPLAAAQGPFEPNRGFSRWSAPARPAVVRANMCPTLAAAVMAKVKRRSNQNSPLIFPLALKTERAFG